jgi:hypothetical protein
VLRRKWAVFGFLVSVAYTSVGFVMNLSEINAQVGLSVCLQRIRSLPRHECSHCCSQGDSLDPFNAILRSLSMINFLLVRAHTSHQLDR